MKGFAGHNVLALLAVTMLSCTNDGAGIDTGVDPIALGIERSYALAACKVSSVPGGSPPCVMHATAAYTRYLDSARVVLTRERSATVMLAYHDYSCPCYMFNCSDPCTHGDPLVDHAVGKYTLETTRLRVSFADDNHLTWSGDLVFLIEQMPLQVPRTWSGPDSIMFGSRVTGAILRP